MFQVSQILSAEEGRKMEALSAAIRFNVLMKRFAGVAAEVSCSSLTLSTSWQQQ